MSATTSLIVRAAAWACALPMTQVRETMRELDCVASRDAPSWVRGVTIIRGEPTPVVDLASLLGGEASAARGRYVTVRCHEAIVAVRVDSIVGVRELDPETMRAAPRLLDDAGSSRTERLGVLDDSLLAVLDLSRVLTPEQLAELTRGAS